MARLYKKYLGYYITENKKERTVSIYSPRWEFLSTVNEGELNAEIRRIENGED